MSGSRQRISRRRPAAHFSRQPLAELLEGRTLLSGNVTAAQAGPLLTLQGDWLPNAIEVSSGYGPHVVVVQGLNYTRVNGSYNAQVFYGVEMIDASMDGGNDTFKATNLCLTSDTDAELLVDGGAGDDWIRLCNTTVRADAPDDGSSTAAVRLTGEVLGPTTGLTNSSGNDIIEVLSSTVSARGGDAGTNFIIIGDDNSGGTVTCGNDRITVSDTCVTASTGVPTGTAAVISQIYGDAVAGDNVLAPATTGQGNDCISLCNATFSATAADCATDGGNLVSVDIQGDHNGGSLPLAQSIGVGNDNISLSGVRVTAAGSPTFNDVALQVFGEDGTVGVPIVGQGDDCISFSDVRVSGDPAFQTVRVSSDTGDDHVEVACSSLGDAVFEMGDGDDYLKITHSTFELITVDGGLGYDVLVYQNNNPPVVVPLNFEEVYF